MKKYILALLVFVLPLSAQAATRYAVASGGASSGSCTSGTPCTLSYAISGASDGDTIEMVHGTYSGNITVSHLNLTIHGESTTSTIRTGGFIASSSGNGLRITNMRFSGATAFTSSGSSNLSGIRVDHNYLLNTCNPVNFVENGPKVTSAVIDHNTIDGISSGCEGMYIFANVPMSGAAFPYSLGMDSSGAGVYIEDNYWKNISSANHIITQSRGGSRVVVRYNIFEDLNGDAFDAHDNYEVSNTAGSATWEYYENVIRTTHTPYRIWNLRGGQGVIFDNYAAGNQSGNLNLQSYLYCEGTCSYHQDSDRCDWATQGAYAWGNKYSITNASTCDPHVAPCTGGTTWNWSVACGGGGSQLLVQNVDYFNSSMPGYTAYTYPHPLAAESTPEVCGNDIDDDGDGLVDCQDDDCDQQTGPNGETCEYGTELTCNDGYDNDGDGTYDNCGNSPSPDSDCLCPQSTPNGAYNLTISQVD